MARFIIAILLIGLAGCANLTRDAECGADIACQAQMAKWDKYDNWGKADPHANIEP